MDKEILHPCKAIDELSTSISRPMTIHEKHKLGKLIQKLPPENLDRVMEIIRSNNAAYTNSSDEVYVDLEKEVTCNCALLYGCLQFRFPIPF